MSPARRNDLVMVAAGVFVVLADQLTKHWITQYFTIGAPKDPISLAGPVLQLIYDQNTGVAFSLFEGQTFLFLLIAIAIAVVAYLYWRLRASGSLLLKLTFGLILGGAIGNLIDRFSHKYVVDFIHFQLPGRFDFPVFNLADSSISVGVVLLAVLLWRADSAARTTDRSTDHATSQPTASEATPANPRKVTTSS
ncbi:MAG TPA: signal peptidase II [Ktedonobacterales bacterium]|nr:signal peptidase II [Ktedonobacterales bacterium]